MRRVICAILAAAIVAGCASPTTEPAAAPEPTQTTAPPSAAELVGELGPELVQRRVDGAEGVLDYIHPEGIEAGLEEASQGHLASGVYAVFVYEDAASARDAYDAWKTGMIGSGIARSLWRVVSETQPEDGAYTVVLSGQGVRSVTLKGPYVLSVSGASAATRQSIEEDFLQRVP